MKRHVPLLLAAGLLLLALIYGSVRGGQNASLARETHGLELARGRAQTLVSGIDPTLLRSRPAPEPDLPGWLAARTQASAIGLLVLKASACAKYRCGVTPLLRRSPISRMASLRNFEGSRSAPTWPALMSAPFLLAGGCKIVYDILLFRAFAKHREDSDDPGSNSAR